MARHPRDLPVLDWVFAGAAVCVAQFTTPLVEIFTKSDAGAQRGVMTGAAGVLGVIAGFAVTATFFYATLQTRSAIEVKNRWGGFLDRTWMTCFVVITVSSFICLFCSIGAGATAASLVFFSVLALSIFKLVRLLTLVLGLLNSAREVPVAARPRIEVLRSGAA